MSHLTCLRLTLYLKFTCPPNTLGRLTSAVVAPELSAELLSSELIWTPLQQSSPVDEIVEAKIIDLVDDLEQHEDTLRVWTTLDT
jgi:translational activator of cytochrome c oxidase 1